MAPNSISEITAHILELNPDPVVRIRLQRDVLHIPAWQLTPDKEKLEHNPWVQQLIREQHPDGSWGRFHSRDSQSKQKIITTEIGVARGLALGLDPSHPVFCRVVDYLTQLLRGDSPFPDRAEQNDRWPTGVQLFVAATLAQLKPNHPFVDESWDLWAEIASRSFSTGSYDPEAEIQAHQELTGAAIKNSYLVLNNKYALTLLSARVSELAENLEKQLFSWVWHHPLGVRYIGVPARSLPIEGNPSVMDRWFNTLELLSRFPSWGEFSGKVVEWLWSQQREDGFWDFGPRVQSSYYLSLSDSWRKPINRKIDWTTRILIFLAKNSNLNP